VTHRKAILARDYMTKAVATLSPDMTLLDAVELLLERRISGAPVVDEHGNLVGLLSEKDCLRAALNATYYGDLGGLVSDHMQRHVATVADDTPIFEVTRLFINGHFRRYPVMHGHRLVGSISRRDVLRALQVLSRSEGRHV
jgi:CBS domain-containing protein